ncbi:2-oxoglutarate- and Fe(II)-dependent oxygenase Jmj1 [Schizosaccharomyces osmophilus]|uniref:2-oxoglutarate- and Fe(II)-dependent oxygenase Jmj1 n=1 Tax=Schizosaccharomyces osmophilus TaxID=2545709 RepID=A0AAE9WC08_9SCHI|nr:2-oxoglutarate- and Fe(II)-dependent oxygenase Jmj1 [Schizosaccharomyces osmophilus]WBW73582.1 2-oxoglutarate- and Fe(II)-dependent oxygenase Jmj1 [Schizosaccharomyces osmophilus]
MHKLSSVDYLEDCTYSRFLENYLKPCIPVLIGKKLTENWESRKTWVRRFEENDELSNVCKERQVPKGLEFLQSKAASQSDLLSDNLWDDLIEASKQYYDNEEEAFKDLLLSPNYEYLKQVYGNVEVPLAYCSQKDKYGSQKRENVQLGTALQKLEKEDEMLRSMCLLESNGFCNLIRMYPKDMHLFRNSPVTIPYETPDLFVDDWLNAYTMNQENDDFRFSYIGSHLSTTPLHKDVYESHSVSVNLCGVKCWIFIPPSEAEFLQKQFEDEGLPSWISQKCLFEEENFRKIQGNVRILFQFPGQTVFVPSGWYHQVLNIGTTLSINHNWCNSSCILPMHFALQQQYEATSESLQDLLDDGIVSKERFSELVTEVVEANYGWSWERFWLMVSFQLQRRLAMDSSRAITLNSSTSIPPLPKCVPPWSWEKSILIQLVKKAECPNGETTQSIPANLLAVLEEIQ